jgi:hypothetical protein
LVWVTYGFYRLILVGLGNLQFLQVNTVFREVVDNKDHENILSLALPALPQHDNGTVLTPR